MLVVVRNIEDMDHSGGGFCLERSESLLPVKSINFIWDTLKSHLYLFKASKNEHEFLFDFTIEHLKIKHNLSDELLKYTEFYYMNNITDIQLEDEDYYNIIYDRKKIRIVFDGPKELEMVWRLSI